MPDERCENYRNGIFGALAKHALSELVEIFGRDVELTRIESHLVLGSHVAKQQCGKLLQVAVG